MGKLPENSTPFLLLTDNMSGFCGESIVTYSRTLDSCFEPRRGFQNRHVFRSHFGGVDHRLQSVLRAEGIDTLLPVQHTALVRDAAETPFFPADGQVVILDGLYRETVLPQPNGGFFKETELRGSALSVHCKVLLVSKK